MEADLAAVQDVEEVVVRELHFALFDVLSEKETVALFTKVFGDSEGENEGNVIGQLVSDIINTTEKNDYFGCQAFLDGTLVGCIFFTRLRINEKKIVGKGEARKGIAGKSDALLLSPVAVATEHQNKGFGHKLIKFGLETALSHGSNTVFTYGDPAYYGKLGFKCISEDKVKAPHKLSYPHGWLMRIDEQPEADFFGDQSHCVSAFDQAEYW